MTEVLNHPEVAPDNSDSRVDTGDLEAMFATQNSDTDSEASVEASNIPGYSELSPTGSMLIGAATRINGILERRAVNKAHDEALKEYRERDYNGYVDHLGSLEDSSEVSPAAKASARMALDREYLKADIQEKLDKAKDKVRGFGRSALSRLKGAGLITAGLGIMSAEATGRSVKKASEATKTGTIKFGEKVGDGFITGLKKVEAGMDSAGETVADIRSARRQAADRKADAVATQEAIAHAEKIKTQREKEAARQERREAALARKNVRHAKWASRREAVKQGFVDVKDATVKGAKFAKDTVKTNAEFAGAATREISREQKAKLGRFAARARAAGEGAVDGWKSV